MQPFAPKDFPPCLEQDKTPNWAEDSVGKACLSDASNFYVKAISVPSAISRGSIDGAAKLFFPSLTNKARQDDEVSGQKSEHKFYSGTSDESPEGRALRLFRLPQNMLPGKNPLPPADCMPGLQYPAPDKWGQLQADGSPRMAKPGETWITTQSVKDKPIDATHPIPAVSYKLDSPEAKLYLSAKQSVVRISLESVDAEGKKRTSTGSGFFVTEDGQIATASHVSRDTNSITVTTDDGRIYQARVKEERRTSELAVLELVDRKPGDQFKPLPLAKTAVGLESGEKLMVLGHPSGVTDVVMSLGTFRERVPMKSLSPKYENVLPTSMFLRADVRVHGGNSGGPVLNDKGEVVGLTNFKVGGHEGNFAGVDDLRSMIDDPKLGRLSDQRNWVFPSSINFDKDASNNLHYANLGLISTSATYLAAARPNMAFARIAQGGSAGGLIALGAIEGYKDFGHFRTALQYGSTAERISTGSNLTSDFLMSAGGIASVATKYRGAGALVATAATVFKLGNGMFSDRRYY